MLRDCWGRSKIKSMNKFPIRTVLIPALALVACACLEGIGATYQNPFGNAQPSSFLFVSPLGADTNPGTSALPKLTIQAAVVSATAGTAILVRTGTYRENVSINKSGTADKPIWLIAIDGFGSALIDPPNAVSTIQGYGVHYILIQGFHIVAPRSGGTDDNGVKFAQAGNDFSQPNSHIAIMDNIVDVPGNGESGIKISQASYVRVVRNSILNPVGVGIDLPACQDAVVAWNYCANASANSAFAIYVKGGSYNIAIHDNYVVGSKFGIFIGQSSAWQNMWLGNPAGPRAWEARHCSAYNNITHDNASQGYSFMGSVKSHIVNSIAYRSGWMTVTAQSNMVNSMEDGTVVPALFPAQDTVYRCAFDRTTWFWADSGCSSAVSAIDIKGLRVLVGNSGNNTVSGGFAVVTSGAGHDTLVLSPGSGITEITDFLPGSDIVRLVGFDSVTLLNPLLLVTQVGPHCVLRLPDGNALWFDSLQAGSLSAHDFDIRPAISAAGAQQLPGKSSSKKLTVRYIGCDGLRDGGRFSRSGGSIFSIDGRKHSTTVIRKTADQLRIFDDK